MPLSSENPLSNATENPRRFSDVSISAVWYLAHTPDLRYKIPAFSDPDPGKS